MTVPMPSRGLAPVIIKDKSSFVNVVRKNKNIANIIHKKGVKYSIGIANGSSDKVWQYRSK